MRSNALPFPLTKSLACRRLASRAVRVPAAALATDSHKTHGRPPAPPAGLKMRLPYMFEDTHQAMVELGARVLDVTFLFKHTYHFRHPDDVNFICSKDGSLFAKSQRVAQSQEFLGNGIFSQLDYSKHAAARYTLNPAFRMDYLKQLDKIFVASAGQLAALLREAAAAGLGAGADAGSGALDMQRMFRLMAIDSIGLTSMQYDFHAISSWRQQQQQQQQLGEVVGSSMVRVEQLLQDLSAAFIWQSLLLPVPRSWLPGWGKYIAACGELDRIVADILAERRALAASSGRQNDLVGYLLQAQQQQGSDVITDEQIGFEIKTMMFGGSDTSSFALALLAHQLAVHPGAADRAAAEVAAVLQERRGDVMQLTANDAARMPFVTACVNETLRLTPAGPGITRTATQDVDIARYKVSKGQDVVANIWAMHRHPDIWPQAEEWLPQRWMPEGAAAGLAPKAKNAFLPFSTGARSCIGRSYAMLQMVLATAVLLGQGIRFTTLPGRQQPPRLAKSLTMYAEDGVWLVPVAV